MRPYDRSCRLWWGGHIAEEYRCGQLGGARAASEAKSGV